MNLNNNNDLIDFFNIFLQNEVINQKAPELIKFFIITRNYGLINLKENIENIYQNKNLEHLITNVIIDGFKKDNISYTKENIIRFLIKNYYENGFYYHKFPLSDIGNIKEKGLTLEKDSINIIISKYHLENYFNKFKNILITDYLDNNYNFDISQEEIKRIMQDNKLYQESDYKIIDKLYNQEMFSNEIGIALIPKKNSEEFFGKYINLDDVNNLLSFCETTNMSDYDIINFLTNVLSHNKIWTSRTIPKEKLFLIGYQFKKKEKSKTK